MMREIPLLTAQMGRTGDGSHWAVYVVLPGESRWPEVLLPADRGIPRIGDRATALKRLGYVPFRTYPYWDWVETENLRDTESPVRLIATLTVVPAKSEHPAEDLTRHS
ncbi:DUF6303 family protein [Streptomyces scopuliridis]|uniref:DUF6303 family protein n=1 Tax=Streptomyces scopuliridis TaxID=452529 RepID=UPI002DDA149F|nr:DUF6303 family protein [Streptomyces scopuliridis]WSB34117.1 DUF6303 family protein [Streptomyces scopuliridis]